MNKGLEIAKLYLQKLKTQGIEITNAYLYGSYAYGTTGPHSDIDLLVVVEQSELTTFQRDAIAYRSLGDIPVPIDVQVYTKAEFEERAALTVSFERTVKRKGKLLHAA
mgnify:CR=1 FL=1